MMLVSRTSSFRCPVAALFALPLSSLFVAGGASYAPEPDATDTQYWQVEQTLAFESITLELESGTDVGVPEIEMDATRSRTITMDQVHEAAKDGAPTSLRRTFVELEDSFEGQFTIEKESVAETIDAEVEIPLDEKSVRFRWSDKDEDWSVMFIDEDGEPADGSTDDLAGLAADAHLGGLLANLEEPTERASWTADAAVLAALVCPGGKLHAAIDVSSAGERGMQPALAGLDPLLGMELWDLLGGEAAELDGGIDCKVSSLSSDAMVTELTVDVTSTCDVSEKLARWLEGVDVPMPINVSSGEATLQAEGQGSVTWDLKTGLPIKLELELELNYTLEREAAVSIPGQDEDTLSTVVELSGTLRSKMSAE